MKIKITSKSNQIRSAYCNLKNASYDEKTGMYELEYGTLINEYHRADRLKKLEDSLERELLKM